MTQALVLTEVQGRVGFITLNRPTALNALNLEMIRALTHVLQDWQQDDQVQAVALRGSTRQGAFGALCAGGDIRFFHQCLLSADPRTEDFFTEEYTLNHLIHAYPKPFIAFMDGVVMGGGMGLCQGGSVRLVTERSKLAMPETLIGLFPDVGAGYFLSRCPGHSGEWLALTGPTLGAAEALALGLADRFLPSDQQAALWQALAQLPMVDSAAIATRVSAFAQPVAPSAELDWARIDHFFALPSVQAIVSALEDDASDWARQTAGLLRQRSPLMLHVALQQIRTARRLSIAQDLQLERGLVRHCFYPAHLARRGAQTETAEGIRALVIDKDHAPHWNPARIEDVTDAMVQAFFDSPWPAHSHPLRGLG